MKYYELWWTDTEDDILRISDYDCKDFDLRLLKQGKPVNNWDGTVELFYDVDSPALDYVPNPLTWLIFSDRLVEIMREMGIQNMQVFPISILREGSPGEAITGYNIVNIAEAIAAADREHSVYVTWGESTFNVGVDPNRIKYFRRLVLNSNALTHKPDIFLLEEVASYFIVSQRFKKTIERENVTGMRFVPIEVARPKSVSSE